MKKHCLLVCAFTALAAAADVALVPFPSTFESKGGVYHSNKWAKGMPKDIATYKKDASIPAEGYRISVTTNGITITSSDDAGAFYALQTLRQMAEAPEWEWTFECAEIEDAPAYRWRGVHLDESRHFFGAAAVKKILDLMAYHKLNVFHWHLTDNRGWRLAIDAYPKLMKEGATAEVGPLPFNKWIRDVQEGGEYGPFFYTKDEVREILAYAKERFITVVPEIEIPGHSRALLCAYPELACFRPGDAGAPTNLADNVVCVGNPDTFTFFEKVIDETCELFPSQVIHIGGDEVRMQNWQACPKCQKLMKEKGLKTLPELQAYITTHFVKYLAKKGRRALGWDEILEGGIEPSAMVMSWRGPEGGVKASKLGHDVVMNPHRFCYFDYPQGLAPETEPVEYVWFAKNDWCELTLQKAYAFDPVEGIAPEFRKHIVGGECLNWSEATATPAELEWKMWPRTCATAQVFWCGEKRPPFWEFFRQMKQHRAKLVYRFGVNSAPLK